MQHKISQKAVADIIHEVEVACGVSVPAASRDQLIQRIDQLLVDTNAWRSPVELKQVSILLSDLRGFTALTEAHKAVDVIAMLNRYLSRMCKVIVAYGGKIDKFMGDSIMVLFGAPDIGRDDLQRAIACAIEMQLVMNEVNAENKNLGMPQLYMGIGISTGEVVAGNVGSDLHREYTVIGDNVNLVSRIEAHSLRGQVLLSEHTYELAKDFITVGDMKEVQAKGKRKPLKIYELKATRLPRYMELPSREARRSPRIPVDIPLTFQIMKDKHILPEVYRGKIADISYSGMRTRLKTRVPENTGIKFSIAHSVFNPEIRDIYARILRTKESRDDYECSVEFTSVDDAVEKAIRQFVDQSVA